MRELGHRGGVKSGKMRRLNSLMMGLAERQTYWEATGRVLTPEQVRKDFEPMNFSGGSHDDDWLCRCGHFSSGKRIVCGACHSLAPPEGRLTRATLRGRKASPIP